MAFTLADNNGDDILDVRDIIERIEELDAIHDDMYSAQTDENLPEERAHAVIKFTDWCMEEGGECSERAILRSFMESIAGYGGDEQWEGSWYPVTLIRDSYFPDYAEELIKDCGYISKDLPSWIEIDWQSTAKNIQVDYDSAELVDVTYWYR